MIKQVRLFAKGGVIGVGFRAWTKLQAKQCKIAGWVKNEYHKPDVFGLQGGVEMVLQGEEKDLFKMISIVKVGSPVSIIEDTALYWETANELFEGFKIKI